MTDVTEIGRKGRACNSLSKKGRSFCFCFIAGVKEIRF
jgi:hypothetical protein